MENQLNCEGQVKQSGQVASRIESLNTMMTRLEETIQALETRLGGILEPQCPSTGSDACERASQVPVAAQLSGIVERIEIADSYVKLLIQRVQL